MADRLLTRRVAWHGREPGAMQINVSAGVPADESVLDPLAYGSPALPVGVGGRQAAWFVQGAFGQGVLRQYRRGGVIARLSADRYVWTGEARSRSMTEFALMTRLFDQGLPVPEPLAAGYWRRGLTYRAALLTRRIPGARALAQRLSDAPLPAVAQALVDMHRAGIWHADLNAFNIMVDDADKVWLIDFDRGTAGGLTDRARQANLDRLARSLDKVGGAAGQATSKQLLGLYRDFWAR